MRRNKQKSLELIPLVQDPNSYETTTSPQAPTSTISSDFYSPPVLSLPDAILVEIFSFLYSHKVARVKLYSSKLSLNLSGLVEGSLFDNLPTVVISRDFLNLSLVCRLWAELTNSHEHFWSPSSLLLSEKSDTFTPVLAELKRQKRTTIPLPTHSLPSTSASSSTATSPTSAVALQSPTSEHLRRDSFPVAPFSSPLSPQLDRSHFAKLKQQQRHAILGQATIMLHERNKKRSYDMFVSYGPVSWFVMFCLLSVCGSLFLLLFGLQQQTPNNFWIRFPFPDFSRANYHYIFIPVGVFFGVLTSKLIVINIVGWWCVPGQLAPRLSELFLSVCIVLMEVSVLLSYLNLTVLPQRTPKDSFGLVHYIPWSLICIPFHLTLLGIFLFTTFCVIFKRCLPIDDEERSVLRGCAIAALFFEAFIILLGIFLDVPKVFPLLFVFVPLYVLYLILCILFVVDTFRSNPDLCTNFKSLFTSRAAWRDSSNQKALGKLFIPPIVMLSLVTNHILFSLHDYIGYSYGWFSIIPPLLILLGLIMVPVGYNIKVMQSWRKSRRNKYVRELELLKQTKDGESRNDASNTE